MVDIKNKGGRPKKAIDYDAVQKLAQIMCTEDEIAAFLGVCTRTLQRDEEFCRVYKTGLDRGKMSLRRAQFKLATSGNTAMLIWLGKQHLGQKDNVHNDVDLHQPIMLVVDEDDMNA
ncbi:MAG: hypothetical protein AB7F40_04460 [Victivallaceae bacterium]